MYVQAVSVGDLRHPTATYLSYVSRFPAGHRMAWQHVGTYWILEHIGTYWNMWQPKRQPNGQPTAAKAENWLLLAMLL